MPKKRGAAARVVVLILIVVLLSTGFVASDSFVQKFLKNTGLTGFFSYISSILLQAGCIDADGDGYEAYNSVDCPSGNDCNDNNIAINPGAAEIYANGQDDDCNGFDRGNLIQGFTDLNAELIAPMQNDVINTEEGKVVRFKIWVHDSEWFYYYELAPGTQLPSGATLDKDRGEFQWVPDSSSAGTHKLTFRVRNYDYKQWNKETGTKTINPNPLEDNRTITINIAEASGAFSIIPSRQSGPAPFHVMFNLKNIPDNAAAEAVKPFHLWWEFGDGGIAQWFAPGHIYSNQGASPLTYTVKAKIVDNNFNVLAEAQTTITVQPEPNPSRTFYVSPTADGTGTGDFSKPWTLRQGFRANLIPGDRLYLRGGFYDLNKSIFGLSSCVDFSFNGGVWNKLFNFLH